MSDTIRTMPTVTHVRSQASDSVWTEIRATVTFGDGTAQSSSFYGPLGYTGPVEYEFLTGYGERRIVQDSARFGTFDEVWVVSYYRSLGYSFKNGGDS